MAAGILAGRLAIVTGAGSGIGRAVCQLFVKEGARVAAVDVNQKSAQETSENIASDQCSAFSADVSSAQSVNELLNNVQKCFSAVPCIAVNSAGITRDTWLVKMDEAAFDKVIDVNLKGTFLLNQALGRLLIQNKLENASIVNISSIAAKTKRRQFLKITTGMTGSAIELFIPLTGNMGQCNYAASKCGVIGFTKSAAKELARYGIRVNAILPGFIETPMTDAVPKNVTAKVIQAIPLGRSGTPAEVAELCLFLASDRSSYMTGTAIEVTAVEEIEAVRLTDQSASHTGLVEILSGGVWGVVCDDSFDDNAARVVCRSLGLP